MSCCDDSRENLAKAVARVEDAVRRGAEIVCLQELFRSRYFCQTEDTALFDLAEPIPGETTAILAERALRLGVVIVASLFEKRAEGVYHNTAVVLDADGSLCGIYRKMHIPDDPLYYEKFYFTPGDTGFRVFDTAVGRIGALVCWDQWFPEAARLVALRGARIIFYPTAIGWHPSEKNEWGEAQTDAWETMHRAHAIANGAFVVAVNRVGVEGGIEFWGNSLVYDPFGRLLARASRSDEATIVVPCELGDVESTRRNWPFFRDRRIDAYADLTRRFIEQDRE
jgi:N-carbamoylputrescine amidase